nr:MAG TPA_asm: hypothetical protein [Caudoviricetes sp.]
MGWLKLNHPRLTYPDRSLAPVPALQKSEPQRLAKIRPQHYCIYIQ